MTTATISAEDLSNLGLIDRVVVYRDLDHPAWSDPDIDEFVGTMRVIESDPNKIRLSNGVWYSRHNGTQLGDAITFIKKVSKV